MVDIEERKRLGQYFTGESVARVLAALAEVADARSIIDPMAGSGDMLVAAHKVGATSAELTAIEIDPAAAALCSERVGMTHPNATIIVGDAFSPSTWVGKAGQSWDVVITNP